MERRDRGVLRARRRVVLTAGLFAVGTLAAPAAAQAAACTQSGTQVTCAYATTGEAIFGIPGGVTSLGVVAIGGSGGSGISGEPGGAGASVAGTLGNKIGALYVEVGRNGASFEQPGPAAGGANGGGAGAAGGGGASDIRIDPAATATFPGERLIVAGGGGGAGGFGSGGPGGAGGAAGQPGADGTASGFLGAGGGGQSNASGLAGGAGGAGGTSTVTGARPGSAGGPGDAPLGVGGAGGGLGNPAGSGSTGGGGGGGYDGGGGGGQGASASTFQTFAGGGGGGGGSSFGGTATAAPAGTPPSVTITYTVGYTTARPTSMTVGCSPSAVTPATLSVCTFTVTDTGTGTPSIPTGGVGFVSDGAGTFSSSSCVLSPVVRSSTAAACHVNYTPGGFGGVTQHISASYNGDAAAHSGSSGSAGLVILRPTSTDVSCSPSSPALGVSSSCTATVTDTGGGIASAPAGAMAFTSNGSGSFAASSCPLAAVPGHSNASACSVTYTPSAIGTSAQQISATYAGESGSALHNGSAGSTALPVGKRSTRTLVTCPAVTLGTGVSTCVATVSDTDVGTGSAPSGSVSYTSNGSGSFSAPSCALAASGAAAASCSVTYTPGAAGTPAITATYGGDGSHAGSSSSGALTVSAPPQPQPIRYPAPVVGACRASGVGASSATLMTVVDGHGAPVSVRFAYGRSTGYGSMTAAGGAAAAVRALTPGTRYHCRAVATSAGGTSAGADGSFVTAKVASGLKVRSGEALAGRGEGGGGGVDHDVCEQRDGGGDARRQGRPQDGQGCGAGAGPAGPMVADDEAAGGEGAVEVVGDGGLRGQQPGAGQDAQGFVSTGGQVMRFVHRLLGAASAAAVVAGLTALPAAAALPANCSLSGTIVTCTYTTVGESTFTVPAGVSDVEVIATGGAGGADVYGNAGGVGAVADATVAVGGHSTLYVEVGGKGPTANGNTLKSGGSNGGGGAGAFAGAGGGASDVRTASTGSGLSPDTRLVIAGGGGGRGAASNGPSLTGAPGGAAGASGTAGEAEGTAGGGAGGAAARPTGTGGGGRGGVSAATDGSAEDATDGTTGGLGTGGLGGEYFRGGAGGGGGLYGGGGGGGGAQDSAGVGGGGGGGGGSSLAAGGSLTLATAATAASVVVKYNTAPNATTTVASCQPGSVIVGVASTCTATVTDTGTGTKSTPTGAVTFGSTGTGSFSSPSCTLTPTGTSGVASCSVNYTPSAVAAGGHLITATYQGDIAHGSSAKTANLAVTLRNSSTSVSCSGPVALSAPTTCTATVSDPVLAGTASAPSGTVLFTVDRDGSFSPTVCTLTSTSANAATCAVSYTPTDLSAGTDKIFADYGGDGRHDTSPGVYALSVTQRASAMAVACSPASAMPGVSSSCTATVSDSSSGTASTPTGSVSFTSSGSGSFSAASCSLAANSVGVASCSVSYTPSSGASGAHSVTGSYGGDGAHAASSGVGALAVSYPAPAVAGCGARGVSSSSATLMTVVDGHGAPVSVRFAYGRSTGYGSMTAAGGAAAAVRALTPGTRYHCRAVATSAGGTSAGADGSFVTAKVASGLKVRSVKLSRAARVAVAGSITTYANNGMVGVTLAGKVGRRTVKVAGRARVRRGRWSLTTKLPVGKARSKWSVTVVYGGSSQVQAKTLRGSFRLSVAG